MTTTAEQPTRPVQPGRATVGARRPVYSSGSASIPRSTAERPWDRVRFVGPVNPVGAQELAEAADGAVPGEVEGLPEPGAWAGALVRSAVETLLGARPAAQLSRWLSMDLYERLARRAGLAVRVHGRPRAARPTTIRSVRVCAVREGVAEVSVVLHDGQRVRAAAVRLEVHRGRWRATALEIG